MDKVGKLLNFVNFDKLSQNYENLLNIMKFRQYCELFFFVKIVKFCQRNLNLVEIMMSEHCVRHRTLMMVCGIVLGKAKTTKVGMVWYELNIVNLYGRYRAGRAAKSLNLGLGGGI